MLKATKRMTYGTLGWYPVAKLKGAQNFAGSCANGSSHVPMETFHVMGAKVLLTSFQYDSGKGGSSLHTAVGLPEKLCALHQARTLVWWYQFICASISFNLYLPCIFSLILNNQQSVKFTLPLSNFHRAKCIKVIHRLKITIYQQVMGNATPQSVCISLWRREKDSSKPIWSASLAPKQDYFFSVSSPPWSYRYPTAGRCTQLFERFAGHTHANTAAILLKGYVATECHGRVAGLKKSHREEFCFNKGKTNTHSCSATHMLLQS